MAPKWPNIDRACPPNTRMFFISRKIFFGVDIVSIFIRSGGRVKGGAHMGRNRKVGLDWWPRDIGLYRDPKLRAARQKFGVLGPYVYECLLDIAYGDKDTTSPTAARAARTRCGSSASTPPDWKT